MAAPKLPLTTFYRSWIQAALGNKDLGDVVTNVLNQHVPGGIPAANLDVGAIQYVDVTLTSAQILALHSTPITLIPAPAAGFAIQVDSVAASLKFGTTAYTGANALTLNYTNGSGATAITIASSFLDGSANANTAVAATSPCAIVAAAPIVAAVGTANPAAGDSTITMRIIYRIVPAL